MKSRPDPGIERQSYCIQIDVRSLCAPSRLEFVKDVIVRNRREEPGFSYLE